MLSLLLPCQYHPHPEKNNEELPITCTSPPTGAGTEIDDGAKAAERSSGLLHQQAQICRCLQESGKERAGAQGRCAEASVCVIAFLVVLVREGWGLILELSGGRVARDGPDCADTATLTIVINLPDCHSRTTSLGAATFRAGQADHHLQVLRSGAVPKQRTISDC